MSAMNNERLQKELKRFEALILRMRSRIIELHNCNRILSLLNSISGDRGFEEVLKLIAKGFKIDGCELSTLSEKGLETVALYGELPKGKMMSLIGLIALNDENSQIMKLESGSLLSLPVLKGEKPIGVLNLYKTNQLPATTQQPEITEVGFSKMEQRLFKDIAIQIGVALERVFL